ncbi:MAG: esterase-like activity of phytase family protein [Vicinamibacterales bacterium]
MTRAGIVGRAVAVAAAVAVVAGAMGPNVRAAGETLLQTGILADTALRTFHNNLFREPFDQISEDRGVRLGSLGSDIFQGSTDSYNEFWTVTDRGPNGNPGLRTFLYPKFNPVIMYVRVQGSVVSVLRSVPILDANGNPVTGVSNVAGFDEVPYNYNGTEQISYNPNGLDTEGLVRAANGDFWLVDEYTPSLVRLAPNGRVSMRYVPEGTQYATTAATTPNYRVSKTLPGILNRRRANRGFEGLAITPDGRTLVLAMQSPLDYPTNAIGRASRNVRIFTFDLASDRVTGEYVYHFDEVCTFLGRAAGCGVAPGEMKISGLDAISSTEFIVLERTDTDAKVYRVDLTNATNILGSQWDTNVTGSTASTSSLEGTAALSSIGVTALPKTLVANLEAVPGMPDKIEGISLVAADVLAVANDNDFGLVDNATFTSAGVLSNDTNARSQILYVQFTPAIANWVR